MAVMRKKGQEGAAATYMTRERALRKLQLSLADFRRLCILKGIYPREPKNKKKAAGKSGNTNNTFYYTKDIKFLLHEPLVQKIRDQKAFMKKLKKASGKRQTAVVNQLQQNKPTYTLDHIIRERYPSFEDALRDLDDCLCHIALFASLPASERVPKRMVEASARLLEEFKHYIALQHALQLSFLSIKGIYYQASIWRDIKVTWLEPYQFSQELPMDVDWRVMLTFLEFYHALLSFVNFKLFSEIDVPYPLIKDEDRMEVDQEQANDTTDMRLQSLPSVIQNIDQKQTADESTPSEGLYAGLVVFLSREVPREPLEFVLKANGATVCYPETSGLPSKYQENDDAITHHIIDRPMVNMFPGRKYVQPQWVFDSLNKKCIMQEEYYGVGKPLPPHLSPFYAAEDESQENKDSEMFGLSAERKELINMLLSNKKRKIVNLH